MTVEGPFSHAMKRSGGGGDDVTGTISRQDLASGLSAKALRPSGCDARADGP